MNKYIKCAVIATIGLALTGCGRKKISCTYSEDNSFTGLEKQQLTYTFSKDGKTIEEYTEIISVKYTDKALKYYDEDLDDILDDAEKDCDEYEDADFITCKVELKGGKITQTITYNLKGLDEDDVKDLYDDKDISSTVYSKVKELLDQDYKDVLDTSKDEDESLYKYNCR